MVKKQKQTKKPRKIELGKTWHQTLEIWPKVEAFSREALGDWEGFESWRR